MPIPSFLFPRMGWMDGWKQGASKGTFLSVRHGVFGVWSGALFSMVWSTVLGGSRPWTRGGLPSFLPSFSPHRSWGWIRPTKGEEDGVRRVGHPRRGETRGDACGRSPTMANAGGLRVVIKLPRRSQEEPRAPPIETDGTCQTSTKRKREVRGTHAWKTTKDNHPISTRKVCPHTRRERRRNTDQRTCDGTHVRRPTKRYRPSEPLDGTDACVQSSRSVKRNGSYPDETHENQILPRQQTDESFKARNSTRTFVRLVKK